MERVWNSYKTLKKKNKVGGLLLLDFKTYHKAIVIKTVRQLDQWNRMSRNKYVCGQLFSTKVLRLFNRDSTVLSTDSTVALGHPCEINCTSTFTLQHTHSELKIKMDCRPKLNEENIAGSLCVCVELDKDLVNRI